MHVRSQIRHAVVDTLKTIAGFADKVHSSRNTVFDEVNLDCFNVIAGDESIEPDDIHDSTQSRELEVIVEAYAMGVDAVDDQLDGMIAEAEIALKASSIGVLSELDVGLAGIDSDYDESLSEGVAKAVMRFSVGYEVQASNPTVLI